MDKYVPKTIIIEIIIPFILVAIIFSNFTKNLFLSPIRFSQNSLLDMRLAFVSCFFPIKSGKIRHPISEYKLKASKIFQNFPKSLLLYIFTTSEGNKILEEAKYINNSKQSAFYNIKIITKYQSVFEIPEILKYKREYEEISEIMNREPLYKHNKRNISLEIGSIWNSKLIFLREVINQYNIYAKLIFWIDIGIFKNDEYFHKNQSLIWPSIERIEKIFSFQIDLNSLNIEYTQKMLFWVFPKKIQYKNSLEKINLSDYDVFIHAAFFGGPRQVFLNFLNEYWKIHDTLIKQKQFVLREEFIFAAYVVLNKEKAFFINMGGSKCYIFHSSIGFISKFNLCNYKNKLLLYAKKGKILYPVYYSLDSWL